MAENTAPAACTDQEWDASRESGLLFETPGTTAFDAALHRYTERMQQIAYAEGRKDEAEEHAASILIDAWVASHGTPIPWEKAVEILAIVNKLPEAERIRLLALAD